MTRAQAQRKLKATPLQHLRPPGMAPCPRGRQPLGGPWSEPGWEAGTARGQESYPAATIRGTGPETRGASLGEASRGCGCGDVSGGDSLDTRTLLLLSSQRQKDREATQAPRVRARRRVCWASRRPWPSTVPGPLHRAPCRRREHPKLPGSSERFGPMGKLSWGSLDPNPLRNEKSLSNQGGGGLPSGPCALSPPPPAGDPTGHR